MYTCVVKRTPHQSSAGSGSPNPNTNRKISRAKTRFQFELEKRHSGVKTFAVVLYLKLLISQ
jgi:hypothetical protein